MKNNQKQEYKKYLEELCDPNYQGGSWALPANPTPLEQAKYEICKQVVSYKLDTKISTEAMAEDTMDGYYNLLKSLRKNYDELVKLKESEENTNLFLEKLTNIIYDRKQQ